MLTMLSWAGLPAGRASGEAGEAIRIPKMVTVNCSVGNSFWVEFGYNLEQMSDFTKRRGEGAMASAKFEPKAGDAAAVAALMAGLTHPRKAEVEALRKIIKSANPKLNERVKWNAPSYFYKADFASFNLHQEAFVQLIILFPHGLIADDSGLLLGDWKDRREARFQDMKDVKAKAAALTRVVNQWVAATDGFA
jgi:hypothetical protein